MVETHQHRVPPPPPRQIMAQRPQHDPTDDVEVALADASHLAQRLIQSRDAWLTSFFGAEAAAVKDEIDTALASYRSLDSTGIKVLVALAAIVFALGFGSAYLASWLLS